MLLEYHGRHLDMKIIYRWYALLRGDAILYPFVVSAAPSRSINTPRLWFTVTGERPLASLYFTPAETYFLACTSESYLVINY